MLRVASLAIYPVKSLRGLSFPQAEIEPWGLAGDRRFMLVDPHGRFLTQREHPVLATLSATFVGQSLRLTAPSHPPFDVPLLPPSREELVDVIVWGDRLQAWSVGDEADAWFKAVTGVSCRLVHMANPGTARQADQAFAQPGDTVTFADGFPLLVTTTASLADLNARLDSPIGMDRFRPNLVVEGGEPWMEDQWRSLKVGDVLLEAVKPCARCVITTTDQTTGARDAAQEPLRTLATFRRGRTGGVIFGQNVVPRSLGRITLGDPVTILT